MFDEKIDVAEIMKQIKESVTQSDDMEEYYPLSILDTDQSFQSTVREIAKQTKTIRETRRELHDARNVGGVVPRYGKFPAPLRQFFSFFSRIMRKGIQFVIQDQVDVNSQLDTILSAVDKKEELMMQLILRMEESIRKISETTEKSDGSEALNENID